MKLTLFLSGVVLSGLGLFHQADGHAYLTKPKSRETGAVEDASGSMGCPRPGPGQVTSFQAGESIDVRYWRNNHIGGFIRWAIVPQGKESKEAFDQNVFYYTCRESGATCLPKGENSVFSGDNSGDDSISCGDKITLPTWLPAGDYVLQWTWMSAGSSYGHRGWANPQYRSCADIRLTTAGTAQKPKCPTFVGGDRVTALQKKGNDVCFYFYSNDMVKEVFKGDDATADQHYRFGVPKQIETCGNGGGGGGGGANTTAPVVSPTPSSSPSSGPTNTPTTATPSSKPDKDDDGPGQVHPGGPGKKGEWAFCTANDECANGCCSKKYSDDGKLKCTPSGC